jgi:hypothetical protein
MSWDSVCVFHQGSHSMKMVFFEKTFKNLSTSKLKHAISVSVTIDKIAPVSVFICILKLTFASSDSLYEISLVNVSGWRDEFSLAMFHSILERTREDKSVSVMNSSKFEFALYKISVQYCSIFLS